MLDINIIGIYINSLLFSFFLSMVSCSLILKLIDRVFKWNFFIRYDACYLFIFLAICLFNFLVLNSL